MHWGGLVFFITFVLAIIISAYYEQKRTQEEGTDFVVVTICDKNEDGKSMCWNEYRTVNSLPNWKNK